MPVVVYIFTLSAFALGLAEFVPIGLTDVVAHNLGVGIEQAGSSVTLYALGATFAAPILSALTAGWSRKKTMLMTLMVFTAGSLVAAIATSLPMLLAARFVAGMGHGLFLAVASSTAARLVGQKKAGSAVATVFGGFTIAMAIGVPLSTYLGGVISWRPVFGAIAAFGALGFLGLLAGMKAPPRSQEHDAANSVGAALKTMFHPALLFAALVTVLGYAGSFTAYTYIAPLLMDVTHVTSSTVGTFMLAYGVLAAFGNVLGGKITDRLGVNSAGLIVISGIAIVALAMWAFSTFAPAMGALVALLGMFTFASVPALQARLIGVAEQHAPHAHGVAAGLNIAGFNSGIALGSIVGGLTIHTVGIAYTGISGAVVSGLGLVLLLILMTRDRGAPYHSALGAGD
ncbi:MFS transporter [Burkholderia cepacia]|uniref:Major facilitator superfamily MFS 1 n=1 Tax=Burkholderia cepacia GG4 TaxID=1009846 RepID=A0A9W3JYR1_BURCE|nr:MFS transporter [Burkholderia cepacia]AFQ47777.1 Major facilitator superfamily MFS 1 [Burkholderia cepacia GG4]